MSGYLLIAVIALALLGAPIFACMAAIAIMGAGAVQPGVPIDQAFAAQLTKVFANLATGSEASTLATIPLFVFAGYVMAESRTAQRLVAFAQGWFGWVPGGLAIVTILACAFFTTVTGASGVTIVAIGGLIYPSLLKEQYKERFALGLVSGTGSIGLLFPPALPLIVYGIVYGMNAPRPEGSTGIDIDFKMKTFLSAGIIPGLLLVGMVSLFAVVMAHHHKVPRRAFTTKGLGDATLRAIPELLLPIIIIVPIVTGVLQIPEAAVMATLYVLVVEMGGFRDLKLKDLARVTREAVTLVGAIFVIMMAATALTDYFINAEVPRKLYEWMDKYIHSPWTFLLALNVLLLIVGCLMDIFSAIVVVVPLIAPAAQRYGIDPYHLGVIFILNLEIGYLTPPVGMNLFITSYRFRKPMLEVTRASLPFMAVMLLALGVVTYLPLVVPGTAKAFRLVEDAPRTSQKGDRPVADGPPVDAGVVTITWRDGGVWTPGRCEQPEIKDDSLAYMKCLGMFKLYARCSELTDEGEKLTCWSKVKKGKNPFRADAAPEESPPTETASADAGP
jgi:tripartite ATP-independent transporter DctM subunit